MSRYTKSLEVSIPSRLFTIHRIVHNYDYIDKSPPIYTVTVYSDAGEFLYQILPAFSYYDGIEEDYMDDIKDYLKIVDDYHRSYKWLRYKTKRGD